MTDPAAASRKTSPAARALALVGLGIWLAGAIMEFHGIAAGTGAWYADISLKWFVALAAFVVACVALFLTCTIPGFRRVCSTWWVHARSRLGGLRLVIAGILAIVPALVLQYTPWGVVLRGPYLRSLLWALCTVGMAWAICSDRPSIWSTKSLLGALVLSGSMLVVAAAFTFVTAYPFSLGWSEGNRLWDYSLAFGKSLYQFDPGNEPVAYLDIGRQVIGGLPFFLPRVSIEGARFWLAIVATVPYVLLGLLAFTPKRGHASGPSMLLGLFALLFLSQGPIHAPLVVCAILVLLAWRLPMLWAALLVCISGFVAETSRFTWMFAPAMWAAMLELGGATINGSRIPPAAWRRGLILGAAGLVGSAIAFSGILGWTGAGVGSSASVSTSQALLWYRLLPNATYADGVLLGLLKAAGPLIVILAAAWPRFGPRNRLQRFLLVASLMAFLAAGLIVSTKIGGGGDLHNLDMFLIGLVLAAAVLWQASGENWLREVTDKPLWYRGVVAVALILPAYGALMSLQPLQFASEAAWLSTLTGVERPRDLGSLPDDATVEASLEEIRSSVAEAAALGPVLFMDQRQLLTFGYVSDVDLVPEYEKKRLMDEALSANAEYFGTFYDDLEHQRFALIVSSPMRTPIKDSEYGFGEENNAWVQWVARPVLCFYREQDTLNDVKVELLVPGDTDPECAAELPGGHP